MLNFFRSGIDSSQFLTMEEYQRPFGQFALNNSENLAVIGRSISYYE